MIAASRRPLTANVNDLLAIMAPPVTVADHLIHAWDALAAASKDEAKRGANVFYANRRAACAEALLYTLKGKRLDAGRSELATLRAEIAAA